MSIIVSEKKLKSKSKQGDRIIVTENIKYPHFESEKHRKLCEKMNRFYSSVAEKYSYFARKKLPSKIKFSKFRYNLPTAVSMNYTIALCNDEIVSVVLDLAFSESKNVKCRRFSQMWSLERQDILPLSEFIKIDRHSKRKIYSLIAEKARENAENSAFGYFEDFDTRLYKNFDIRCCFAVPKGICFFVNAGILSPVKYGANNFILLPDAISEVIIGYNSQKNGEKAIQNSDIVNNV